MVEAMRIEPSLRRDLRILAVLRFAVHVRLVDSLPAMVAKLGPKLEASDYAAVRERYRGLLQRVDSIMESVRRDGRDAVIDWNHPFIRSLVEDGVIARQAA